MQKSETSIEALLRHFARSCGDTLQSARDAVLSADAAALSDALESVKKHAVSQQIATLAVSSAAARAEFLRNIEAMGELGETVVALTLTAAGAVLWSGAAPIAQAFATAATAALLSEVLVIVGVALVAIGVVMLGRQIYRHLKTLWSGIDDRIDAILSN